MKVWVKIVAVKAAIQDKDESVEKEQKVGNVIT